MSQFTKNVSFTLRSVSVTRRPDHLKASEPSQTPFHPDARFPDGTIVTAIEPAGGGEWMCKFPGLEDLVKVSTNKIAGSPGAVKYTTTKSAKESKAVVAAVITDPATRWQIAKNKVTRLAAELAVAEAEEAASRGAAEKQIAELAEELGLANPFSSEVENSVEEIAATNETNEVAA